MNRMQLDVASLPARASVPLTTPTGDGSDGSQLSTRSSVPPAPADAGWAADNDAGNGSSLADIHERLRKLRARE